MNTKQNKRFQSQNQQNQPLIMLDNQDQIESDKFLENREFQNQQEIQLSKQSEFYSQHFGIITSPKAKQMMEKVKKPQIVLLPPENQNKPENGSLFNLFQSDYFTISMLIQYYHRKFNNNGINAFLTNKLYQIKNEELEFYIPQLIYLIIKQQSNPLEKFLQKKCAENISMFFLVFAIHLLFLTKISWCLQSFSDQDRKDKKKAERLLKIDEKLEQAMVNGQLIQNEDKLNVQNYVIDKGYREKYQVSVSTFISNLIEVSLLLKTYKVYNFNIIPNQQEERKQKLKTYIQKANFSLENFRQINKQVEYCHGIIFPFKSNSKEKYCRSNMIVRIIEDECTCFNTKKRVPYRIVVETIDIDELIMKQDKREKVLDLDNPEMVELENFISDKNTNAKSELEKIMREIVQRKRQRDFKDLIKLDEEQKQQEQQAHQNFFSQILVQINQAKKTTPQVKSELNQLEHEIKKRSNLKEEIRFIMGINKRVENNQEQQDYDLKLKRFTIAFPPIPVERAKSCIKVFQRNKRSNIRQKTKLIEKNFEVNRNNNYRYAHKSEKDLTTQKKIQFFKRLFKTYPNKKKTLEQIFQHLEYDVFEQLEKQKISANNFFKKLDETEEDEDQVNTLLKRFGPWEELWEYKSLQIQKHSPYGNYESYQLRPIIVKGGDDLRQEVMAMQIISKMQEIFQKYDLPIYLRPYEIIVTSANSGILEFCCDTLSVDGLKKKMPQFKDIVEIYKSVFGHGFEEAQKNFIESLAGYSLFSYLVQVKDRHNGNILISSHGHIIHIDFGFILSISPGGINFESAPFKMTSEYVEMMNGKNSDFFRYFKSLLLKGLTALQKEVEEIVTIIEMMMEDSDLPCFEKFDLKEFRARFYENATDNEMSEYIERLVDYSTDNWRTIQYDNFQKMTNGIMP